MVAFWFRIENDFEDQEWGRFKTGPGKYNFSSFHANSHITYSSFIYLSSFICRDEQTRRRRRPAPFQGNHRYFFLYICLPCMALNAGFLSFMLIRIRWKGAGYEAEEINSSLGSIKVSRRPSSCVLIFVQRAWPCSSFAVPLPSSYFLYPRSSNTYRLCRIEG